MRLSVTSSEQCYEYPVLTAVTNESFISWDDASIQLRIAARHRNISTDCIPCGIRFSRLSNWWQTRFLAIRVARLAESLLFAGTK